MRFARVLFAVVCAVIVAFVGQVSAGPTDNASGSVEDQQVTTKAKTIVAQAKDIAKSPAEASRQEGQAVEKKADPGRKSCHVQFSGQKLELKGDVTYARAEYRVSEDCTVILDRVVFSTAGAAMAQSVGAKAGHSAKASRKLFSTPRSGLGTPAARGWHGCAINVWEEDFPGIHMINLRNHTAWDSDSSGIIEGRIDGFAQGNLDWWWVEGDIFVDIGYVNAPHVGGSIAGAQFVCDGSNFCRTCSTAGCRIVLNGHFEFNSAGSCTGWGTYDGEIVPMGRFDYEVIRE